MIKLKTLLTELGEGVPPYQWSGPDESRSGGIIYYFTTEDKDDYQVIFSQSNESLEKTDWSVDFFARDNNEWSAEIATNRGRQYRIISTVMDIILSFIKNTQQIQFILLALIMMVKEISYMLYMLKRIFLNLKDGNIK